MKVNHLILLLLLIGISSNLIANEHPDCSAPNRWAPIMAFVHLKNAGITNNKKLIHESTESIRISSEEITEGLYRQVHLVTFHEVSGKIIKVITVNDASHEECSMSDVKVFVVSEELGSEIDA